MHFTCVFKAHEHLQQNILTKRRIQFVLCEVNKPIMFVSVGLPPRV